MDRYFLAAYTAVALLLAAVDFYFARKAFGKPEKVGKAMGWCAVFAGIVTLAYVLSVNTRDPRVIRVSSCVVFIGIDCMLVSLVYFAFLATANHGHPIVNTIVRLLAALDIAVMVFNMFTGLAVQIVPLQPVGVRYSMTPPYVAHLAFTYALVALTMGILIRKCVHTPLQYRNQYLMLLADISLVVAFNALFLFPEGHSFFTAVDCSLLGYSLGLYLMYWTAYDYRTHDMLNSMSRIVVESVNQGVVLFDYMDRMIMKNPRAGELLKGVEFVPEMSVSDFLSACGVVAGKGDRFSVRCDLDGAAPLRLDYRRLKDRRGSMTGHLCVFTDISRDADLTTGFEYLKDASALGRGSAALAVFDLTHLREVNRERGWDEGDRRIRALARHMREQMPKGTAFYRGVEACLIAVCPGATEREIRGNAEAVVRENAYATMYGLGQRDGGDIAGALEDAYLSMRVKKLLSPGSERSQSLNSLVRALEEADADTEAHVQRTQRTGAELGARIGLNDLQMAQLKLLCLLHDIGKIGVPLEILNKPGRLTDEEWDVLRTHPEKGYQIAISTDELKPIAEMIRCHHERWDAKGYPHGLAGEDIPVLSRIIAVVDAYDAMVNDRSYRKALTPERAQEEIRNNAGAQFDPRLADEFLALLREKPELAVGERVGGGEARGYAPPESDGEVTGFAVPIAYSRYVLNEDSVIIEADARFEEVTGYSCEDAVGRMTQLDLIPPEDRAFYMMQVVNQFGGGNMAYLRHKILRKDGQSIQVACYGKRFFDSAVKAFKSEIIVFQI